MKRKKTSASSSIFTLSPLAEDDGESAGGETHMVNILEDDEDVFEVSPPVTALGHKGSKSSDDCTRKRKRVAQSNTSEIGGFCAIADRG